MSPIIGGPDAPSAYVLFLSGVGAGGNGLLASERSFLAELAVRLPFAAVVAGVFPYARDDHVRGMRRALERRRLHGATWAAAVLGVRNLVHVLVSARGRRGEALRVGVARRAAAALVRVGYLLEDPRPVVLLGVSGGAQIAVACAPELRAILGASVEVVSVGGVVVTGAGLPNVDHVLLLVGRRDLVQVCAPRLFPRARRQWHRACREGRIDVVDLGPIAHRGDHGYFGEQPRRGTTTPREAVLGAIERMRRRFAVAADGADQGGVT